MRDEKNIMHIAVMSVDEVIDQWSRPSLTPFNLIVPDESGEQLAEILASGVSVLGTDPVPASTVVGIFSYLTEMPGEARGVLVTTREGGKLLVLRGSQEWRESLERELSVVTGDTWDESILEVGRISRVEMVKLWTNPFLRKVLLLDSPGEHYSVLRLSRRGVDPHEPSAFQITAGFYLREEDLPEDCNGLLLSEPHGDRLLVLRGDADWRSLLIADLMSVQIRD